MRAWSLLAQATPMMSAAPPTPVRTMGAVVFPRARSASVPTSRGRCMGRQEAACSERLPKHEATGVAQAQVDAHAWVPGPEVLPSAENSQSHTEHRPRLIARAFFEPSSLRAKKILDSMGPASSLGHRSCMYFLL